MPDTPGAGQTALLYAFAPIHKRALGVAVGAVSGLLVAGLTVFHVVLQPTDGPPIGLLAHYFYGYKVSWSGAAIGLCWAFLTGFVLGWFVAFVRNLIVSITVFTMRTKAELEQTATFLDHI